MIRAVDLDSTDNPLDVLEALDAYRAAAAEAVAVREAVAKASGVWGLTSVESLRWIDIAAAAARADREAKRAASIDHRPLLPEVDRIVDTLFTARERFSNLALKHSRLTVLVRRKVAGG